MPIRETEQDRIKERRVLEIASVTWAVNFRQRPKLDPIDGDLLCNGWRVGLAEVECRHDLKFGDHGSLFFNMAKYEGLKAGELEHGVPGYMLWQLEDMRVYWIRGIEHGPDRHPVDPKSGRTDRNAPEDLKDHILVPYKHLTVVKPRMHPAVLGDMIARAEAADAGSTAA